MFLLVLMCLGLAAAAPHFRHHHGHRHGFDEFHMDDFHPAFGQDMFDTNRFWIDIEAELRQLDDLMRQVHTRFPGAQSTAGIVDNQYKVTIPLTGFEEKEIIVKAREGVLMVQATHNTEDGIGKNYLEVRSMPESVDVAGVWTYENEVLTITFPLKQTATLPTTIVPRGEAQPVTEESTVTEAIEKTEDHTDDVQDADVGLRSDFDKEHDIQTNEITKVPVEATTYAVDLKNQYEFVPVHY
ncbi:uncharacterized protein LOC135076515 [Ostrinia nubilalis]|uniref:uncharacterized protein LOC135076515 n=1 Tax=Ostrinia nubilalis TaxID=29057 RepID=UPI00308259C8